jgi:hypothetical protein
MSRQNKKLPNLEGRLTFTQEDASLDTLGGTASFQIPKLFLTPLVRHVLNSSHDAETFIRGTLFARYIR